MPTSYIYMYSLIIINIYINIVYRHNILHIYIYILVYLFY